MKIEDIFVNRPLKITNFKFADTKLAIETKKASSEVSYYMPLDKFQNN